MKTVRIAAGHAVAAVVILVAASCGSGGEEETRSVPADSASSESSNGLAVDAERAEGPAELGDPTDDSSSTPSAAVPDETAGERDLETAEDGSAVTDAESFDTETINSSLMARVSDATAEAASARFEGRLVVTAAPGSDVGEGFDLSMSGAYDLDADAFDMAVDLSGISALVAAEASPSEAEMLGAMLAEPIQLRSIGETAWVHLGAFGAMFGVVAADGDPAWIETEAEEAASMTTQLGVDGPASPIDLLEALTELDATVTEIGSATIRGTETTHYLVSIDLDAAAASLPAEQRAELEAELPDGIAGELPIELWMDDDDRLRRLVVELDDFESLGLGQDMDDVGSMLIEFEVYDIGEPVTIERPPAGEVVSSEDLGFGFGGDF